MKFLLGQSMHSVNGFVTLVLLEHELGGVTIYVPESGDQIGYYACPSTPYAARFDVIELRGEDISSGFRMMKYNVV